MRMACLAVVIAACATTGRPTPVISPAATSEPLPALVHPRLDGGTFSSSDAQGQVLVLDVWATYCAPCRTSFPVLSRLAAARPDVVVVGLSIDEGADAGEQVRRFLAETPAGFTVALDPDGLALAPPLAIRKVPTLILVDRAGRVRLRIEEPTDADYRALPALVDGLRGE